MTHTFNLYTPAQQGQTGVIRFLYFLSISLSLSVWVCVCVCTMCVTKVNHGKHAVTQTTISFSLCLRSLRFAVNVFKSQD